MARNLIPGDATIKAALGKGADAPRRLSDGDGLYLLLAVNGGSPGWRLDYSVHQRRKTLSLGTYPDTTLALARKKADEARRAVSDGQDPSDLRKAAKEHHLAGVERDRRVKAGLPPANSFQAVAEEWFDTRKSEWSEGYAEKVIARLKGDVFPFIGIRPIATIKPPELLQVLRRIEERGVIETAHRVRESCSQVFRFAVACGKAESDPARDLTDALRRPSVKHFPAIVDPVRLGQFLRASYDYSGTAVVRAALRLVPMLMLRPGELRQAQWSEIDLEASTWTIGAARMKRRKEGKENGPPHVVPLPRQAVKVLRDLQPLTVAGQWVFRGERHHTRPMSENTVNAALRAMGFGSDEVVGHGFRATARTMLAERLGVNESVIEAQLAHSVKDALGRAYNRTDFIEQRRLMMQTWADYLDHLRVRRGRSRNRW